MAVCILLFLAACGGAPKGAQAQDNAQDAAVNETDAYGYTVGSYEDIMRTAFFDFTVNDAWLSEAYEDYVSEEGRILLAVDITVHNYTDIPVIMYDLDFRAQWVVEPVEDYALPMTTAQDGFSATAVAPVGDMLPSEYEVAAGESVRGVLLFSVPLGQTQFSLAYEETFSDGTTGDPFTVYFAPDERIAL